jgi:hypothetical protein
MSMCRVARQGSGDIPLLEVADVGDASLCICDHFDEEVGKGGAAELGILAPVQVAVVYALLVGRIAQAGALSLRPAHGWVGDARGRVRGEGIPGDLGLRVCVRGWSCVRCGLLGWRTRLVCRGAGQVVLVEWEDSGHLVLPVARSMLEWVRGACVDSTWDRQMRPRPRLSTR